ncbi:MAG TPA: PspC domain-containing protein [Bacteroidetes bacterium]|nr:PspC domain-containing protein [Bacteroidota bacterium]
MKKTQSINIRGIVIIFDEDAFQRLNSYLDEINKYFKTKKGYEDIINDIETRIAELFQQKLNDKKQVITLEDVEEVIAIMGHPSDFDMDTEEEATGFPGTSRRRRRLFRDMDNRMIGGVCAGLSAYFNTDMVWFRIAFVIALFLGGSSILVYLVLWVVVPPARTVSEKLEMQGDPVTISNIEKSFKEEMSGLKDKLNDLTKQAKETFHDK